MLRFLGKVVRNSVAQLCISYFRPKGKYFLFVDYVLRTEGFIPEVIHVWFRQEYFDFQEGGFGTFC